MVNKQDKLPILEAITEHIRKNPISFHVPGHKNGEVFPIIAPHVIQDILKYDVTELPGLDDLHHPEGVIKEAQNLTAELYGADNSYFLIGGTTVGNLAMILSICEEGEHVIVQRNSHKSVMNALELVGAKPIFVSPAFEEKTNRYSLITADQVQMAILEYKEIKAIILTYPDYFGRTFEIKKIIEVAHSYNIPVLVDEAHGAHFILGDPFPPSAISLGADIVVQSAHKMLPAMTMSSYLHIKSNRIQKEEVEHYLQLLQSSSPSYPLLVSLDLARHFLAHFSSTEKSKMKQSIQQVREIFEDSTMWKVSYSDDPLKIILDISSSEKLKAIKAKFVEHGIFPELATSNQILFIYGLGAYGDLKRLALVIQMIQEHFSEIEFDDKIDLTYINFQSVNALPYSYNELKKKETDWVTWDKAIGAVSMDTVTPYPPGIPFLLKGEVITKDHIEMIQTLIQQKQHVHYNGKDLKNGISVLRRRVN